MQLQQLATETAHPGTADLDTMPVIDVLRTINDEDQRVPSAVGAALPRIAEAVDLVSAALAHGGRLIYLGAGTSGRLGMLDAAECPPTFGTEPAQVIALLAGGNTAFAAAAEGAEDDTASAQADLRGAELAAVDVVVGLAASGRTPYVLGGLDYAQSVGAGTVAVSCNVGAEISHHATVAIEIDTGPEVLAGSTRMKAGTAQKLVCNMLTTAAMIQLGKVYENLMVDMRPTNAKLVDRARRIVAAATGLDGDAAAATLEAAGGNTKTAIVMGITGATAERATEMLAAADGVVRRALAMR